MLLLASLERPWTHFGTLTAAKLLQFHGTMPLAAMDGNVWLAERFAVGLRQFPRLVLRLAHIVVWLAPPIGLGEPTVARLGSLAIRLAVNIVQLAPLDAFLEPFVDPPRPIVTLWWQLVVHSIVGGALRMPLFLRDIRPRVKRQPGHVGKIFQIGLVALVLPGCTSPLDIQRDDEIGHQLFHMSSIGDALVKTCNWPIGGRRHGNCGTTWCCDSAPYLKLRTVGENLVRTRRRDSDASRSCDSQFHKFAFDPECRFNYLLVALFHALGFFRSFRMLPFAPFPNFLSTSMCDSDFPALCLYDFVSLRSFLDDSIASKIQTRLMSCHRLFV